MINFSISFLDLEYFLLILVRVSCFVFIAPFFSMRNTPARVRVALSVFSAALLYQTLTPADAVVYDSVMAYAIIVMKEALTGFLIGFPPISAWRSLILPAISWIWRPDFPWCH